MTSINPIFSGATGWISDDEFTGLPKSFQVIKNLDIFSSSKSVKLSHKMVEEVATGWIGACACIVPWYWDGTTYRERNDLYFFTKTEEIRKLNEDDGIWYKIYTGAELGSEIWSCVVFNDYIRWSTRTKLYRAGLSTLDANSDITGWIVAYKTFDIWEDDAIHPMVVYGKTLYIWDGYEVNSIDTADTWNAWSLDPVLSISIENKIREMVMHGAVMRIVTIESFEINSSSIFYWDTIAGYPNEIIDKNWKIINSFIIKWWEEYFLSKWSLYKTNWYKDIDLIEVEYSLNPKVMTIYDGKIAIWWVDGISIYGNKNDKYNEVLSKAYFKDDIKYIGCMITLWDVLYFSINNWSKFIYKIDTSLYQLDGVLETRVFIWKSERKIKTGIEIATLIKQLTADQSIKIYTKQDFGATWTIIDTITSTTFYDNKKNNLSIKKYLEEFNYVEIKIEIITTEETTSPELLSCEMLYNEKWN